MAAVIEILKKQKASLQAMLAKAEADVIEHAEAVDDLARQVLHLKDRLGKYEPPQEVDKSPMTPAPVVMFNGEVLHPVDGVGGEAPPEKAQGAAEAPAEEAAAADGAMQTIN